MAQKTQKPEPGSHAVRQSGYTYINPLLECEFEKETQIDSYRSLKNKLEKTISQEVESRHVDQVAVYFRDLENGPWFGVNLEQRFDPASLLKVPLMIAYLRQVEEDSGLMGQELRFESRVNPNDPQPKILKPGQNYKVSELLYNMIVYSDNDSFTLLTKSLDNNLVKKVHQDLGLPMPEASTPEDFVNVREYASLFRVLYNASYLSRFYSEEALALLGQTDFKDGLVSGLTDRVEVAHKFGIRSDPVNQREQLHDCGIVYHSSPYLLCVMTKGRQPDDLSPIIAQISKSVYQHLTN